MAYNMVIICVYLIQRTGVALGLTGDLMGCKSPLCENQVTVARLGLCSMHQTCLASSLQISYFNFRDLTFCFS